jgi:hypothetical protein
MSSIPGSLIDRNFSSIVNNLSTIHFESFSTPSNDPEIEKTTPLEKFALEYIFNKYNNCYKYAKNLQKDSNNSKQSIINRNLLESCIQLTPK